MEVSSEVPPATPWIGGGGGCPGLLECGKHGDWCLEATSRTNGGLFPWQVQPHKAENEKLAAVPIFRPKNHKPWASLLPSKSGRISPRNPPPPPGVGNSLPLPCCPCRPPREGVRTSFKRSLVVDTTALCAGTTHGRSRLDSKMHTRKLQRMQEKCKTRKNFCFS